MATFNLKKLETWKTEENTIKVFDNLCKAGSKLIVDVGAEVGYYTKRALISASDECIIHAYEPDREAFSHLQAVIGDHPSGNKRVKAHNTAIGCRTGTTTIYTGHKSSTCKKKPKWSKSSYQVDTRSIDDLYLATDLVIDILKIDTEGYELEVLQGATEMIKNKRINHIILEVHYPMIPPKEGDIILALLKRNTYKVIEIKEPSCNNGNVSFIASL